MPFEREIRLLVTIGLCLGVLTAGFRLSKRSGRHWMTACADALLLLFLTQYLSVTIPGLFGILNPWTIGIGTLGVIVILWLWRRSAAPRESRPFNIEEQMTVGALAFGVIFAGTFAWSQRWLPVLGNDAVTYHFPVAAQWLTDHRLSLFSTWFYNPANTYSPLAGSTFIAWWMGLCGDDLLARYIQVPPLILLGVAGFNVFRRLRCPAIPAALLMVGLMLCQPMISQSIKGKDDLYLTAFFTTAVSALGRRKETWKLAVAIGLMLACKTTALLALPIFLLAVDRKQWWKQWGTVVLVAMPLAGPWYLRTWLVTGNPLFPLDFLGWRGLCSTTRAPELTSFKGLLRVLLLGTYSLPPIVAGVLISGWMIACIRAGKHILLSGLIRLALIGPWMAIALFVWKSPFPEVRFVFPAFVLLFAAAGIGIGKGLPGKRWQIALAGLTAGLCVATSFNAVLLPSIGFFAIGGLMGAAAVIAFLRLPARLRRGTVTLIGFLGLMYGYVNWNSYAIEVGEDAPDSFALAYGSDSVDAWMFVRKELSAEEPLAYAGTQFVYPLMGPDQHRPLFYVPTRKNVKAIHDLPRLGEHLTGDQLVAATRAALRIDPDEREWLNRLRASGATHLIVFNGEGTLPPEVTLALNQRENFLVRFSNAAAVVYQLHW